MAFDYGKPNSSRFGSLGDHRATILKKVLSEGKIKVFRDPTDAVEKTEITLDKGKIVIHKDYEQVARLSKFKRIDIYSQDDTLLDSIDIVTEESIIHSYTFYFHKSPIGRGNGNLDECIISAFAEGSIDPRYLQGSSVDQEVITTIKKILEEKRI